MNSTKIPFPISSFSVDCRKNLKPYSFMTMAQEVANINATSFGCGYSQLLEKNITWVLSRLNVEYLHPPRFLQDTTMETWQKGMKGPFSIRDYEVRDTASGELLVRATSSWLLIDLGNRSLVRMDRLIGEQLEATAVMKDAIQEPCGKIKAPENTVKSFSRPVRFSDIDYNLHVNNAKYMEWALDALAPELANAHDIASFRIIFNHEARLGDIVEFHTCELSPLEIYVEGRRGEEAIFQSIVTFK